MGRAKRSSKNPKLTRTPQKSETDPSDKEEHSASKRKSLRSTTKAPSPSTSKAPLNSISAHASPVATRSGRKRLSVSLEEHEKEQKTTPQADRGAKRRRTTALTSVSPETRQKKSILPPGSGRKRRGTPKDSANPSVSPLSPVTKRAKIASPARIVMSTPVPSSKTKSATTLKRRRQQDSSSESDANQSEQEEEQMGAYSQSTCTIARKRGAKRSRKAPKKSTLVKKSTEPTKKKSTPSKTPSKIKKEVATAVIYESENGDKENQELTVKEEFVQPVKSKECKQLPFTKKEIEILQRRQLLARLNHDDLSDLINFSNLLKNWPEVELRSPVAASSTVLTIPASHRLWVSEQANTASTIPNLTHGTVNGDGHDQMALAATESVDLESLGSKGAHRGISVGNNGLEELGGGELLPGKVSAMEVNSTTEQHPRLLDTFCVASFSISPLSDGIDGDSMAEFNRLFREIADINPDVFCVKQMSGASVATRLKPKLNSQGYQCSACTDGSTQMVSSQSFIFFNRNIFTEVSTHRRSVQSMAHKLVGQSAYPQLWRDTLIESMAPIAGSNDSENNTKLLVTVLRHVATGSLLLFGCLTDRPQAGSGGLFHTPVTHASSTSTTDTPIPHAEGGFSCSAPTFTVSFSSCHSSNGVQPTEASCSEWCPQIVGSRPDLAAIRAAGCMWALNDIWEEVKDSIQPLLNGGLNGAPHSSTPAMRWVLCANLEASPTSPVYQILRDGYPSDESIKRLRAIRNVHVKDHDFFDATTLLDRLWHAFQHTCTDVCSCYQSVMGIEPPFTRYNMVPGSSLGASNKKTIVGVEPQKCVDYIFCSGSSLHPRQVLIPPCRATLGSSDSTFSSGQGREFIFSLASKIGIVAMCPESKVISS